MYWPLERVAVKPPRHAYGSQERLESAWLSLGYRGPPDLEVAEGEHRGLVRHLEGLGVEVLELGGADATTADSIYTHDPVLVTDAGAVLLRPGKPARRPEVPVYEEALVGWGVPILGRIEEPGTAEAGDMVWHDERTLVVGVGFRTNPAAVDQLASLLGPLGVSVLAVDLPYWRGPDTVLHLMSVVSPVDRDLAVVYLPLLPVRVFELLSEDGVAIVEVPEEEFDTLGANVLAVAPRQVVMLRGNPVTAERLRGHGAVVVELAGDEMCIKGDGGPTCLTRPLLRAAPEG